MADLGKLLIVFGVVEARACERFAVLGKALPEAALREFYRRLARAEARHHGLFLRLAHRYAACRIVKTRLDTVLDAAPPALLARADRAG